MPNVLLFVLLLLPLVAQQQQEQHLHKKVLFASSLKLSNSPQQRVRILTTHSEAKPTLSTCRKFVPSRKCTFDHSLTKCPSQRINEMQIPTPPCTIPTAEATSMAAIKAVKWRPRGRYKLCDIWKSFPVLKTYVVFLLTEFSTICMRRTYWLRSSSTCWVVWF